MATPERKQPLRQFQRHKKEPTILPAIRFDRRTPPLPDKVLFDVHLPNSHAYHFSRTLHLLFFGNRCKQSPLERHIDGWRLQIEVSAQDNEAIEFLTNWVRNYCQYERLDLMK